MCAALLALASPAYATEISTSGGWAYEEVGSAKYQLVWIKGQGSAGSLATAAAPTYAEGATAGPSFDLSGNMRIVLGSCIAGESYCIGVSQSAADSYLMTVGGKVRSQQILGAGGVPTTASDATSATFSFPMGASVTFHAVETCTGTCTQVQNIYGTSINDTTVGKAQLLGTITLNNTTNANFSLTITTKWLYIFVVTSGTGGTTPLVSLIAQH